MTETKPMATARNHESKISMINNALDEHNSQQSETESNLTQKDKSMQDELDELELAVTGPPKIAR